MRELGETLGTLLSWPAVGLTLVVLIHTVEFGAASQRALISLDDVKLTWGARLFNRFVRFSGRLLGVTSLVLAWNLVAGSVTDWQLLNDSTWPTLISTLAFAVLTRALVESADPTESSRVGRTGR